MEFEFIWKVYNSFRLVCSNVQNEKEKISNLRKQHSNSSVTILLKCPPQINPTFRALPSSVPYLPFCRRRRVNIDRPISPISSPPRGGWRDIETSRIMKPETNRPREARLSCEHPPESTLFRSFGRTAGCEIRSNFGNSSKRGLFKVDVDDAGARVEIVWRSCWIRGSEQKVRSLQGQLNRLLFWGLSRAVEDDTMFRYSYGTYFEHTFFVNNLKKYTKNKWFE